MNVSKQQLEAILQSAPAPRPPAGAKDQLIAQVISVESKSMAIGHQKVSVGWFQRWWPVLVPGLGSIACAVVLTVQQVELNNLKHLLQASSPASLESPPAQNTFVTEPGDLRQKELSEREQAEFERLNKLAAELKTEISQLEQLRDKNEALRKRLAAFEVSGLTQQEAEAVEKGRERALSINCINNLKQLGLAVRTWALDNNDTQPPNLVCMSNELSTPKILICPSDTSRQNATNFSVFTPANCSYEYLVPAGTNILDAEPNRVMTRCPIHGHVGLCDGSIMSSAKSHPEWLRNRNGKLYYEPKQADPNPAPNEKGQ
jgi:hypothetical protein